MATIITAREASIPYAIPTDTLENKITIISGKVDEINSAMKSLNMANIFLFQTSVSDLGRQLERMKHFNQGMEKFSNDMNEFNKLLKPISELAHEKITASKIESNINLAKLKAKHEKISEWEAYQAIDKRQGDNGFFVFSILFGAGLVFLGGYGLGSEFKFDKKSKL